MHQFILATLLFHVAAGTILTLIAAASALADMRRRPDRAGFVIATPEVAAVIELPRPVRVPPPALPERDEAQRAA